MGTAGAHVLSGEPRRMLCSEPGSGGQGECELVAPTTVKIVRDGESWGYRADRDSILRYGPAAVTCEPAAPRAAGPRTAVRRDAEVAAVPEVRAPEAFYGSWIVTAVQGRTAPQTQPSILLRIDSGRMFARADCAFLGQWSHRGAGTLLEIGAPPSRPVTSCARGLSDYERAFSGVFQPRAAATLSDRALVIEGPSGAVRATRTLASPEVGLALLPPSPLGDAAVMFGVLEVEGACLYIRTAGTGQRVLPALMQPAWRDPATGVFHFGRSALVPGSEVRLGGSMWRGGTALSWTQAPHPSCDQTRVWITNTMDEAPTPR